MSVSTMVAVATRLAKRQPTKIPAMKFSDWPIFCRCIKEAQQLHNS